MSTPDDALSQLAHRIAQAGLRSPSLMVLDLLQPLDPLNANLASFGSPFVRGTSLEPLLTRLAEPAAWAELRRYLAHQD
ncbi:MAG: hypothetical protein AB4911_13410 [Oscillochloridaceae bacterium umkhey_bin13]